MSEPEHLMYDSDVFEDTPQQLADTLEDLAKWMQQFKYCKVFVRLPVTLERENDFASNNKLARVVCRISILERHEPLTLPAGVPLGFTP